MSSRLSQPSRCWPVWWRWPRSRHCELLSFPDRSSTVPTRSLAFDAQHCGPSAVDGRTLVQFASASLRPVLSKPRFRKLGDPGRDITVRDTPRTDPDERSLAHPVLISDEWRRSVHREKDGACAVEEAIAEPRQECVSTRSGLCGSDDGEFATSAPSLDPETLPGSQGFLVPRSS